VRGILSLAVRGIHTPCREGYDFGRGPNPSLRFSVDKTGGTNDGAGALELGKGCLQVIQLETKLLTDVGVRRKGVPLFPAETIEQPGDAENTGTAAKLLHDGTPPLEHTS
jgi:hypothetical protein